MDLAAAAHDIALVERMGFTRNEAIDLVISRALTAERDLLDRPSAGATARRSAYLEELRDICAAA